MSLPAAHRMWDTAPYRKLSVRQQLSHFIWKPTLCHFKTPLNHLHSPHMHKVIVSESSCLQMKCSLFFQLKDCQRDTTHLASPRHLLQAFRLPLVRMHLSFWQCREYLLTVFSCERENTFQRRTVQLWIHSLFLFPPETSSRNFWSLTEPDGWATWRWVG